MKITKEQLEIVISLYEENERNCMDYGLCLNCGYEQDCCEPDACEYECEECGKNTVYGAAEIVMMGA
jgi:hypothetical protein